MYRSYKQDKAYGLKKEQENKPLFDKYFNKKFEKLPPYHIMDFESETSFLEVKTRTNNFNKYPTTMIPYNKINFAKSSTKDVYFVFVFTDDVYCIKYDNEQFKKYDVNLFKRFQRIDYNDLEKEYLYIPITDLTKMS